MTVQLSFPHLEGSGRGVRRINRYYRHLERRLLDWAARCHRRACALAQEALDHARPLPNCYIRTAYQVTYQDAGRLCILWRLETQEAQRWFADPWAFPGGTPIRLKDEIPHKLRRQVQAQVLLLTEEGVCAFRDGTPVPLVAPSDEKAVIS